MMPVALLLTSPVNVDAETLMPAAPAKAKVMVPKLEVALAFAVTNPVFETLPDAMLPGTKKIPRSAPPSPMPWASANASEVPNKLLADALAWAMIVPPLATLPVKVLKRASMPKAAAMADTQPTAVAPAPIKPWLVTSAVRLLNPKKIGSPRPPPAIRMPAACALANPSAPDKFVAIAWAVMEPLLVFVTFPENELMR